MLVFNLAAQQDDNMVFIEGGSFTMGSSPDEPGRNSDREGPQHQVTVSSFFMGKHPVTQKEYQEIMGTNPSNFRRDDLPVDRVGWYAALEYCNALSRKEGLTPVYSVRGLRTTWNRNADGYRLPTEAEWEYACRAGTVSPFSTGDNITTDQANYDGNYSYNNHAKGEYRQRTTPVRSFAPNQWGLYDMHGNVFEWCWDWFGAYSGEAKTDPAGAGFGTYRVLRGGSWNSFGQYLRSAYRYYYDPSHGDPSIGFRLARNAN